MPLFTASRWQVATYLLGVCPFSIAFLVFLNSSVSFVITDLIGQSKDVGNAVGTLGFADELVALIACPLWGLLSDRIGVRLVSTGPRCRSTDSLGLFPWLYNHWTSIVGICSSTQCVSATPSGTIVFQHRSSSSINYGHRNLAEYVN